MSRKRRSKCTVFVLEEEIRYYDGTLASLKMQISDDEWDTLVKATVEYAAYVYCLKETACPILHEKWDTEDQVYLNELLKTITKIKELDQFILAKYNYEAQVEKYSKLMVERATELAKEIQDISDLTQQMIENTKTTHVSGI